MLQMFLEFLFHYIIPRNWIFWHLWLWYLFIVYQWSNIKLFELQTKAQVLLYITNVIYKFGIFSISFHMWCINVQCQTTSINNITILIFICHMCFTLPNSVVFNFSAFLFLSNHFVYNFDEMLEYLFNIFSCNKLKTIIKHFDN